MAEPPQKPGQSRQDYCTPPELVVAIKRKLEIVEFSYDLAASADDTIAPRFYGVKENALFQAWNHPGWQWLNPPFSSLGPWVAKSWEESRRWQSKIAMLVPAAVGSNWWRDWVHEKCHVLLLNGRVTFLGETTAYPKDCCILLYGLSPYKPTYEVWSWKQQL